MLDWIFSFVLFFQAEDGIRDLVRSRGLGDVYKRQGDRCVLDELLRHKQMDAGEARHHLAAYLFRGEDVFKPLVALSGGERGRLALAILTLEGSNFLVLDEPTNHLDIPAREALQEVLDAFTGTILVVSHDRFLIGQLATQIWELRDGKMEVFKGTYREYMLRQSATVATSTRAAPATAVSYTHLRAHETVLDLVCRLLLEKKKKN